MQWVGTLLAVVCVASALPRDSNHSEGDICKQVNGTVWTCTRPGNCATEEKNTEKGMKTEFCGRRRLNICCEPEVDSTPKPATSWRRHKNRRLVHSGGECGKVKIDQDVGNRILGGTTAEPGSLPWMAYVLVQSGLNTYGCGGSVINKNYILTAAHCLDVKHKPTITVKLGQQEEDIENDESAETFNVRKYSIHPEYNVGRTMKNDIALLRLDRSISFKSPYINYICLPTSSELSEKTFSGERLTMAGWGLVSKGKTAKTLQKVELPVKTCTAYRASNRGKLTTPAESQMCAGSRNVMACAGDSGGPLMYHTSDRVVQVGVLSFGPSVCSRSSEDQFDHYSRVSSFMGWILDTIEA